MTELAGTATHSSETVFRDGAVGQLLPNTELRVRCLDTDVDLSANQRGELLIRSPGVMKRYLNNPQATREVPTADGFVRTGDVGYIDQDGYIFIVDRIKELIKYKGHQVAPAELEDVVNSHPQVAESLVLLNGERPLTAETLMEYVASKVAGYKRVREVEFIAAIPKSLSGKILRRQLQLQQDKQVEAARSTRSRL
ncbi:hypothetical protein PF010_g30400 [Phytophthora fragariae]|uniref:AMP-dependent synthetase/ligase domain-containing protein n=1 Tax=Phytophthora fragariae TaxID=53985 RepID=A0A6G0JL89_9STRA|nr:hypothetical protein PF010_g30400 [Phytophthora fragariae]